MWWTAEERRLSGPVIPPDAYNIDRSGGVEEQFNIIFPFLIWFSGFGRQTKQGIKNFTNILGALTLLSFILFINLYHTNQSLAYFMMPSRFWEMASGSLIFLVLQRKNFIKQYLSKIPTSIFFLMIIGVMFLPVSSGALATILIVFLSSILLISLREKTFINRNDYYLWMC